MDAPLESTIANYAGRYYTIHAGRDYCRLNMHVDVDKMTFVEYLIRVMGKYESIGKQKSSKGNWWFRLPWPAVSIIIRCRLSVIYIHLDRLAARLVTVSNYWYCN